ncbi:helix-turn-helix domain-containing protein [Aquimarina aquimarini]|uniref:helix-turn-helix domain-containing protein n=1 Tax=Aquimarina aquimarini TaxID=1191734 RepID=UPI000D55189B|nr:helix-turn-helix transcriptional regulator [Aquimarina aquimarini]
MVNNIDFGNRIQKIMNHYAISASSFADYMGVGRSSISHILSGRNKPSLDFVMKIVDAYSDVDLQWLLYGKGTFPKTQNNPVQVSPSTSIPEKNSIATTAQDLFTHPPTEEIKSEDLTTPEKKLSSAISTEQKIEKIVFFYADGTFSSYQMKKT